MAPPQTNWAQVVWRKNDTPYAPAYDDGYFGETDPAAEAHHVFCKGLALPDAWKTFFEDKTTFRIVELGFGTGLNFLQTAQLWQKWQEKWQEKTQNEGTVENKPLLDYWGIEAHPLRVKDLQHFYRRHEVCGAGNLLQAWKGLPTSVANNPRLPLRKHTLRWEFAPSIRLTLLLQDVERALASIVATLAHEVDGWYCDGFAPRSNPAMWSDKVFAALAYCTRARTSFPQLASFSVAKSVRTRANAYGFHTRKRKGWCAKREVLQGFFRGNLTPPVNSTQSSTQQA